MCDTKVICALAAASIIIRMRRGDMQRPRHLGYLNKAQEPTWAIMQGGFKRPRGQPMLRWWGRRADLAVRRKLMGLWKRRREPQIQAAVWHGLSEPCAHALRWIRRPESSWVEEAQRLSAKRGQAFGAEFLRCAKEWQQARQDSQFDEKTTAGEAWGCSAIRSQGHLLLIELEGGAHPWAHFLSWWMRKYGAAARLDELFTPAQTLVGRRYSVQFKHEDELLAVVVVAAGEKTEEFRLYDPEHSQEEMKRLKAHVRQLEAHRKSVTIRIAKTARMLLEKTTRADAALVLPVEVPPLPRCRARPGVSNMTSTPPGCP